MIKKGFILIVDDSAAQRYLLQYFLEAHNFKVISAEDGIDALAIIEEITPSLIISDIVMPKMDGYEFCKKIRTNKSTMDVPVILLTVLSNSEDMIKGLECGADSFISKPYSQDYLISLVEKICEREKLNSKPLAEISLPVSVSGNTHVLSIDPTRIISLMISAYESALSKNKELANSQSQLKALNDNLEALVKERTLELLRLNSEKDKFLSIIAHDLKSPFQGFLGMTEILAEEANDFSSEELLKFGQSLNKSANRLFDLLNNLLEWSQMQKDSKGFTPEIFSLTDLIKENIENLRARSDQKGVSLVNTVIEPLEVFADKKMINSTILNLISNGVKFSYRDGIVDINAYTNEENVVEISISDTGIGMDKVVSEKLFMIGEKTGQKGTDGELSTGLGLLLCKEFVEKNGGKIWVESEVGKGSTFYFTLPKLVV